MTEPDINVYEAAGGEPVFRRLVDIFYAKVEQDALLRSVFPPDVSAGKRRQYLFLMQYWGGPQQYSAERGHPRLRMRHAPFAITPAARDAWVGCMLEAIDETGIAEPARTLMRDYFDRAATFMINQYPVDDGDSP